MNFDILVIGSGVVGSALAIKVSKLGYKVAIVDSKESPPNSYRHLSINQKSKTFLDEIGIWKDIKDSAFPYGQIKVWDQDCLLYTSPSPRDVEESRMPSSA